VRDDPASAVGLLAALARTKERSANMILEGLSMEFPA